MSELRPFPIPSNERARARSVAEMDLMSCRDDPFFANVVELVNSIFGTPIAFVSLFTETDQNFLVCQGLDFPGTPRSHSVCSFTVAARETIVLPDATKDPRTERHPVVLEMGLRFSASAPVLLSNGFCMGTVCAVDMVPHDPPSKAQIDQLEAIASMIARFYEVPREPDPEHLKRMQAIAEDAQKEFLALVGHELRTPLNGIHGMAQVLEPKSSDEQEIVDAIVQSSEHLHDIIKSVLAFTEYSNGDIQLVESTLSLESALYNAGRAHRKLATLQNKSVVVGNVPKGIQLNVDAAKVELALSCLVNNCVAHGGSRSEISAELHDNGNLSIKVTDNGSGISEDRQDDIWEAFRVGQDIQTRNVDGIGLGLPLSRKVIELHGGEISMDIGSGSMTVVLTLPHWRVGRSVEVA